VHLDCPFLTYPAGGSPLFLPGSRQGFSVRRVRFSLGLFVEQDAPLPLPLSLQIFRRGWRFGTSSRGLLSRSFILSGRGIHCFLSAAGGFFQFQSSPRILFDRSFCGFYGPGPPLPKARRFASSVPPSASIRIKSFPYKVLDNAQPFFRRSDGNDATLSFFLLILFFVLSLFFVFFGPSFRFLLCCAFPPDLRARPGFFQIPS